MMFQKINKKSFIFVSIFLILIFLLISLCFLLFLKEKRIKILETQIKNLEKEILFLKFPPTEISTPEEFKAGEIGEIEERIPILPPLIFNTTGIVKEIKENGIIVLGSGSNFTDQKPRELTLLFTKDTLLFELERKKSHKGFEGLKYLKPGMEILIEGDENIRGKTEFKVKTINLLSP